MESQHLKNVIEAAMLAAGGPLSIDQLKALFGDEGEGPEKKEIREVIKVLQDEYAERGIELREVASGFRIQVRESMGQWLGKLFEERPPRYTRALMETLAIIAYRQPVTRGDIEEIRGVAVSTNIIRTLLERDWIKVVGHRDVPGKPAMFGTTRFFLDYFGLKKLDDLPPLAELAELEPVSVQLELGTADQEPLPEEIAPDDAGDERADSVLDDVEAQEDTDDAGSDESYDPSLADDQLHDQVDDELDDEVSDEELAAALAVTEAVDKVVSGAADEDANIASLEDARDRSTREPETDFNAERAEVVPIKQS
ncbi:MAG: SMC-Scp complex subunit ScpB [Gammaproteobacteria bacterium]|nr:SMC-Scp complex subunit ScpB [Gammaproteobacteria bacterium]